MAITSTSRIGAVKKLTESLRCLGQRLCALFERKISDSLNLSLQVFV
jgi:hypothetical protein